MSSNILLVAGHYKCCIVKCLDFIVFIKKVVILFWLAFKLLADQLDPF